MENEITNSEYGEKICGVLVKDLQVKCPKAVIPIQSVEHVADMRGLSACFVHVDENNTTYYIDDKYRVVQVYAGAVEAPNYDFTTNPKKLRSQWVLDFVNNKAGYINASGEYRLIDLEVQ